MEIPAGYTTYYTWALAAMKAGENFIPILEACGESEPYCIWLHAHCYDRGIWINRNIAMALCLHRKAAKLGNPRSMVRIMDAWEKSERTKKKLEKKAAKVMNSSVGLSDNYARGLYVAKCNVGKSHEDSSAGDVYAYLMAAAEEDDPFAQYELSGLMYRSSHNMWLSYNNCLLSAKNGYAPAQQTLTSYTLTYDPAEIATVVTIDKIYWLRKAAEQNYGGSRHNLANLHFEAGNYAAAMYWYLRTIESTRDNEILLAGILNNIKIRRVAACQRSCLAFMTLRRRQAVVCSDIIILIGKMVWASRDDTVWDKCAQGINFDINSLTGWKKL